jgi:hypothetical protein
MCSEGEEGGEETNDGEDANVNTGEKRDPYGERGMQTE